jgi:hypothetical protein
MRLRAAGVGLVFALGCGRNGPGIPQAQIEVEWHQAICEREVRCGRMPDVDACLSATSSPVSAQLAADLASGKVAYDPQDGKALVDRVAAIPCGITAATSHATVKGTETIVKAAFRGRVGPGGACGVDEQCAAPAYCDFLKGGGAECAGKCTVPPAPKHLGVSCSSDFGAIVYTAYPLCDDSTYCVGNAPGTAVCTPLPATAGDPCEPPVGCGGGLACVPSNANPTCTTLAAPGGACDPSLATPCDDPTTYCDSTSKICQSRLAVGAPCSPFDEPCVAFAACDAVAGICTALAPLGMPCKELGIECLGDLRCADAKTPCALPAEPVTCP